MINSLTLLAGLALFGLASCNYDSTKSTEGSSATDTTTEKKNDVLPKIICYAGVVGKDSFYLKLEEFNDTVKGQLSYNFYEKDDNHGTINGKLFGDTLVAKYRYVSEGFVSLREVVFLLKENSAVQGSGPMEEKDGFMIFKSRNEFDFSNGITLHKTTCTTE